MMTVRVAFLALAQCAAAVGATALAGSAGAAPGATTRPSYPPARSAEVVDDYHGTSVSDPYRWLEDDQSPATRAFIGAQNRLVRDYLDGPVRERIAGRLEELVNYPRVSAPRREGSRYFHTRNDGLQDQSILLVSGSTRSDDARVLIDPNTWSRDGTVALAGTYYTHDGSLVAYGVSSGGSDQKQIRIRDVETGRDLPDKLNWCKFANVAWSPDKRGFWYNRYPAPDTVARDRQTRNNKVYFHKLGDAQDRDEVVYERPDDDELSIAPAVSDDDRFLLLYLSRGSTQRNRLYYRRLDSGAPSAFVKLFDDEDARYSVIDNVGDVFYVFTNLDAPRGRVIAVDVANPGKSNWRELIPQGDDVIDAATVVGDRVVVTAIRDAHSVLRLYDLNGKPAGQIDTPTLGSIGPITGKRSDREMFFSFTSFTYPSTIFRYDFDRETLEMFRRSEVKFDTSGYETKQVFVASRDGTRVPMFITHRKGLALDGNNPTLVNGYGGFNVDLKPQFSTSHALWLEQGGVLVVVNLRGGGEYGEEWHRAGMLEHKQNVFDDLYSACEWLIDNKYTSRARLAIRGRSNGGLLVAAAITQRPELFGAAICGVPLTDMLRYHRFSVGRFWVPEYGSADASLEQFQFLRAYSPLHNVKPGVIYPPTLMITADGDDRVVPLHARKFTAALQAADTGTNPILLRTEVRSGHGGGKPTRKRIEDDADEFAFLARVLRMDWR